MIQLISYITLFITKFIENTISTLRIIVISHGHKWLGAVLNFVIAIVWSISTVLIVTKRDVLSVLFFAFGCFFGSILGSYMEEKINHLFLNK